VEQGTYEQLLALGNGGVFHRLAASLDEQSQLDRASIKHARGERTPKPAQARAEHSEPEADTNGGRELATRSAAEKADVEVGTPQPTDDEPAASSTHAAEAPAAQEHPVRPPRGAIKRLWALYRPGDKPRLALGVLGAAIVGAAGGFMGVVLARASFPFRDELDPTRLQEEVWRWCAIALALGVTIHVVEVIFKLSFAVAGEVCRTVAAAAR